MSAELTPQLAVESHVFRPVQYLGNKWRLLEEIERAVTPLVTRSRPAVCDLFCGTGVVAARLNRVYPVLAADVQEYARVLTSALLRPASLDATRILSAAREVQEVLLQAAQPVVDHEKRTMAAVVSAPEAVCDLLEHGSLEAGALTPSGGPQWAGSVAEELRKIQAYSVTTRYYGGVYVSYQQAVQLDALATVLHELVPPARDCGLAALISTAAELVASVGGHFAQPVRPRGPDGSIKRRVLTAVVKSRRVDAFEAFSAWMSRYSRRRPSSVPHWVARADFRDTLDQLPPEIGCVYADPPYTRDHYSRFYHVLETLALGDEPGLSSTVIGGRARPSRGLYRADRHQSPFSIVRQAPGAFRTMAVALAARGIPLVLSYSPVPETEKPRARVMALPDLVEVMKQSFGQVEVRVIDAATHAKFNASRLNASVSYGAEVLVLATP